VIKDAGRCASCDRHSDGRPLCESCDARARSSYVYLSGEGQGNYDGTLFTTLEGLEPRSFWFRSRNDVIVWALRRYLGGTTRFLEVGCGTGFVLAAIHKQIRRLDVMGAELYAEGLEVARRRLPGVPLAQMSALEIPFSGCFDAVGAFDVLEHIEEDERALREMGRAVSPGGGLLLTVPQHPRLWSVADDFAGHVRRYRRNELVAKARKAGWEPVSVSSFVTLPLPLFALSRAMRARHDETYDFERELRLPTWLDRGLAAVMGGERALLALGVSFPVGASLLLVARRIR
jgi:SAM-dependent methyltransferase